MLELEKHARIIEQLLEIAADTGLNLDESMHKSSKYGQCC